MKPLSFGGKLWKLHKQTDTKLTFVPAGNVLSDWRRKKELNQRDAATRLGISQGQLARIESGTRTMSTDLLRKIVS